MRVAWALLLGVASALGAGETLRGKSRLERLLGCAAVLGNEHEDACSAPPCGWRDLGRR